MKYNNVVISHIHPHVHGYSPWMFHGDLLIMYPSADCSMIIMQIWPMKYKGHIQILPPTSWFQNTESNTGISPLCFHKPGKTCAMVGILWDTWLPLGISYAIALHSKEYCIFLVFHLTGNKHWESVFSWEGKKSTELKGMETMNNLI